MINIGLSLTNRIAGGAMYKAVASFTRSMFASINSRDGLLTDVTLHGLSTQAGTPTPDVPVPIVSTTGDVTVRSDGANLIPLTSNLTVTNSTASVTYNYSTNTHTFTGTTVGTGDNYFTMFSNANPALYYLAPGTYTIFRSNTNVRTEMWVKSIATGVRTTLFTSGASTSATYTLTEPHYIERFHFYLYGIVAINYSIQAGLTCGTTPTAFLPYITPSTQTLPLGTTQLRSLPNGVSDRIYKDGSTWKLEQNVASQVLSGTENWTVATSTGSPTYTYAYATAYDTTLPVVNTNSSSVMSSTMNVVGTLGGTTPGIVADSILVGTTASYGKLRAYILTSRLATNDNAGVKAWFAANPTTIQYAVRTPVTTTITDPTLITALENIRTYQGVTNITASTPISGQYYSL